MEPLPYRSWVEISRRQIARNFRMLRATVGANVEIAAVVKSDAYGHGAVEVSRVLAAEGASWLAVTSVDEGAELREAGFDTRILVMADCLPFHRSACLEYNLTPVVHSLEELREWDRFCRGRGSRLRYHLKIDSGMGRLGTQAGAVEIAAAVREASHLELEGLMSHFASAGNYTTEQSERQVRQFNQLCAELKRAGVNAAYVHMSSSSPIAYGRREAWHNMVRPGLALYGYIPPASGEAPPRILDVCPALTWKARVLAVKEVAAGAAIGYGALFAAPRPMRIAIIGAGYADGVPHRLSNRGHAIAGGKLVPIAGAVSMDVTTIDVTDIPAPAPGDPVTLLGAEETASIDAQQMAEAAGTISYDILCGIRARVRRVYV